MDRMAARAAVISFALLGMTAACGGEATRLEASTTTVAAAQEVVVEVGETVVGRGLTITYRALLSDNRCPLDVQCITAGNGSIAVEVASDNGPPTALTLNTTEGPSSGRHAGFTIELVDLARGQLPAARLRVS